MNSEVDIMLVLVAAISGVATLVAALWMFLFHEDFGISFFIERKTLNIYFTSDTDECH